MTRGSGHSSPNAPRSAVTSSPAPAPPLPPSGFTCPVTSQAYVQLTLPLPRAAWLRCIERDGAGVSHLLDAAVGQPEDEMLDGHGAVRAPTNVYGRLKTPDTHASRPSDIRGMGSGLIPCAFLERGKRALVSGTLGIIATSIWGVVGTPCSRNACRTGRSSSQY